MFETKVYIYICYLAEFFLELEMFQTEVLNKFRTYFMYNNFFLLPESAAICDILRTAYCIPKARNTNSDYVKLVTLRRQRWLRERVSTFRLYLYCVSCFSTVGAVTIFMNNGPIKVNAQL